MAETENSKVRYIEDLRKLHKKEEIWVIGTGRTLDDYPDDFFIDKTFIVLNWAMSRFGPRSFAPEKERQYIHWYHSKNFKKWVSEKHPEYHPHVMLSLPHELVTKPEEYGEHYDEAIWLRWDETRAEKEEDFQKVIRDIMEEKPITMRAWSTCAHIAIEAAMIMGADRVTLAGCDGEVRGVYAHAIRGGMDEFYSDKFLDDKFCDNYTHDGHDCQKMGRIWLARAAESYGIKIRRYFYESGYEEKEEE